MNKADKETVGRQDFVRHLARRTGMDQETVSVLTTAFLDQLVDELRSGNRVEFRGTLILGTKVQEARTARDPHTGKDMAIPRRRRVYFRLGNRLKDLELEVRGRQLTLAECGMR